MLKIIAVKDVKSDCFLNPNFQRTTADAVRSWEVVSNEGDSLISRFPNDFCLYVLGEFDPNLGRFVIFDKPESLGFASDFKRKPSEQPLPFPSSKTASQ